MMKLLVCEILVGYWHVMWGSILIAYQFTVGGCCVYHSSSAI